MNTEISFEISLSGLEANDEPSWNASSSSSVQISCPSLPHLDAEPAAELVALVAEEAALGIDFLRFGARSSSSTSTSSSSLGVTSRGAGIFDRAREGLGESPTEERGEESAFWRAIEFDFLLGRRLGEESPAEM